MADQSEPGSRLEELLASYQEALESGTAPSRSQFLADNPAYAADLRDFFVLHDRLNAIADSNASSNAPNTQESELLQSTSVGPYRLLEVIGRGGMGIVYRAEQLTPVRRQLALKVIRPGFEARTIIARFEAERQALALMDHSHIARVLDVGTTDRGLPYFAMELVNGLPITEYCDRLRLSPRERVELMIPVCQAVQHAHQKGIIHRDLKPSNILVTETDGVAVARIIDFGLAKALGMRLGEQSLHTDLGTIIGTLEYMSPEQAGLNEVDVDTRSDIYALGVILYELMTGTTPMQRRSFEQAAVLEMLRAIRETEPPMPSSRISTAAEAPSVAANRSMEPARLQSLVRGELDWIVMKALEKDRNRRYDSAAFLAADLRNFLNDEPVVAGPPSGWYRVRKFVRRNRSLVMSIAVIVFVLIAGVIGTTLGMMQARRASESAWSALQEVKRERDLKSKALEAESVARRAADAASLRSMKALQTLTDKSVERLLTSEPAMSDNTKDFLNSIVSQLEELVRASDSRPSSQTVQAEGLHQIGILRWKLGDLREAAASYRRAIDVWESLERRDEGNADYRRGLADSLNNLGIVLASLKDFVPSEQSHRRAIDLYAKLIDEFPSRSEYRQDIANCRTSFGVMLKDVNRNSETIEQYRMAIAIQQPLADESPDDLVLLRQLCSTQNNLALELQRIGQNAEAEGLLRSVLAVCEKIVADKAQTPEDRTLLAASHHNLGVALFSANKPAEGLAEFQAAEPLYAKLAAEYPSVPGYRDAMANLLSALGQVYSSFGRLEESDQAFERYVQIHQQFTREYPDRHEHLVSAARGLLMRGKLLTRLKQYPEAEVAFRSAAESYRTFQATAPDGQSVSVGLGESCLNFGQILDQQQRHSEAIEPLTDALRHAEDKLASDADSTDARKLLTLTLRARARTYDKLEKYDQAMADWDRVIGMTTDASESVTLQLARVRSIVRRNVADGMREADQLRSENKFDGRQWFAAACLYGLASKSLSGEDCDQAVATSLACLGHAREAGFFADEKHVQLLTTEGDLESVRAVQAFDDFRESLLESDSVNSGRCSLRDSSTLTRIVRR